MTVEPKAAVAIIVANRTSILLLRRNHHPRDPWSGHFSFPGGRKDRQDANLLATCLRETYEETGIQLLHQTLASELSPAIAGHRTQQPILVKPFLFHLAERPAIALDSREIQSSCWLDIHLFQQAERHVQAEVLPELFYPAFPIDDYFVWGFTYRLLQYVLKEQLIHPPSPQESVTDAALRFRPGDSCSVPRK